MGQTIGEAIWEEGRQKGELQSLRLAVRGLLADRFGDVPEAVLQRVEHCTDFDRLMAAVVRVPHLPTPEDLQV